MNIDDLTEENHNARSHFIRKLIQNPSISNTTSLVYAKKPPLKLVQFWDRLDKLPHDVKECIDTWKKIEDQGIERLLFDKQKARDYISQNLGLRHSIAFDKCYHPAMQSDYFRLCYILMEGGCYIDTDDVYNGEQIQHLFNDGRLKIQPLCYDTNTNMMVPPPLFTKTGADAMNWIFYFNNNPLIACSGHPVIERALTQATLLLEREITKGLPEIQSTTGPGNLSKSIFDVVTKNPEMENTLVVLYNWEDIAKSKWELNYRNDARNWRLSNCLKYQESQCIK
jgi:mannosyltransferase OCH1-like enzyme